MRKKTKQFLFEIIEFLCKNRDVVGKFVFGATKIVITLQNANETESGRILLAMWSRNETLGGHTIINFPYPHTYTQTQCAFFSSV